MNGDLAQTVALVSHVRAALVKPPFSLDLTNSTFQFVHALTFEAPVSRWFLRPRYASIATTPAHWYEYLAVRKARAVSLVISRGNGPLADHIASAFAGGGTWGIGVVHEGGQELWRASSRPDNPTAPDRKIWSVTYRAFPTAALPASSTSVAMAAVRLGEVLKRADVFAGEAKLDSWRDWFQTARHKLDAATATFEYHSDMLPPALYSRAARTLLSACERAWVFGGMGSWNDLGFDDEALQRRYDALTAELFAAVLDGVAAAVNEPLPSPVPG